MRNQISVVDPHQALIHTTHSARGKESMRAYIQISGVVFGAIALLHIVRLLLVWPAQIGGWAVPLWISWIAILAAGALCGWAFRLVGQARS